MRAISGWITLFAAALPNLGFWYTRVPTEKWALTNRLDWLSASVHRYDGTIVNASPGVNHAAGRHWGMGLNYNLFHLDASVDDAAWSAKVELRYHGPYAYLSA